MEKSTLRISRIKLTNFIGIWEGTGRMELELNFGVESDNRIVILVGKNGSGKTTILSTLHPLAHNGDDRKDIILPGKEGLKEIDYIYNGALYEIQHHYGKSTKSYIQKDGEELNPNGGVRSFEDVVKNELDFDKTYFRIGRIGDNNMNFIDMTATARKNFIFENFLPNVDEYLTSFKAVNKRFRDLKSNINFLVSEIDKIGSIEDLNNELDVYNTKIQSKKESFEEAKETKVSYSAVYNEKRSKIMEDISMILGDNTGKLGESYKKAVALVESKMRDLDEDLKTIEYYSQELDLPSDLNEVKAISNDILKEKIFLDSSIEDRKREMNRLDLEKSKLNEEYSGIETKLKKLLETGTTTKGGSVSEVLEKVSQDLKYIEDDTVEKAKNLESLLMNMGASIEDIVKEEGLGNSQEINEFSQYLEALNSYDSFLNLLERNGLTLSEFDQVNNNGFKIKEIRTEIDSMEKVISSLKKDTYSLEHKLESSSILELRPDECFIDSCSFIKKALSDKKDYDANYDKVNEKLVESQDRLNELKDLETLLKDLNEADNRRELSSIKKKYSNNKIISNFSPKMSEMGKTFSYHKELKKVETLTSIVSHYEMIVRNDERVEGIKYELNYLNSVKDREISYMEDREEVKRKLEDLQLVYEDVSDQLKSLLEDRENILNKTKSVDDYISRLENLDEKTSEVKDLEKLKDSIGEGIQEIVQVNTVKDNATKTVEVLEKELDILTKELESTKVKLIRYNEYASTKLELDKVLEKAELIHEALNPKTGIPVLMISEYLDETAKITNDLLDLSQKGNFRVDFLVNDKEFKIPVTTGELVEKEDINLASQGQKALAKVSLSFALIQQSLTSYNILSLDEMDSTLDEENSRYYIEMLDNQITELGSDQVFLISHNREFDSQPVDLVLLKDHGLAIDNESFMEGKNIIFNLYE